MMVNRIQGYCNPRKTEDRSRYTGEGTPCREKKQTVTITDGLKVVVFADNGVYDGSAHVCINGEFAIDARSVSLLVAALEGKNVQFSDCGAIILGNEETGQIVSACKESVRRLEEKLVKVDDERYEVKRENYLLKERIKQFNESRRPWERKLKIEE